jgi:Flp pilus assembly protein TadD
MSAQTIQQLLQSATLLHQAGQLNQAEAQYQEILQIDPSHADALHLLGVIACQRGQYERGLELILTAVTFSPHRSDYHSTMGNALSGLKRWTEAIAAHRRAFDFDPSNLGALNNLAVALGHDDQTEESLECFEQLIAAKGDVAPWHANRADVLREAGKFSAAIDSLRRAIALQPDLAGAHIKLASALLSLGQFAQGWREFEWRFRAGTVADPTVGDSAPVWDGSSLAGKTLLIQPEQGFGDYLQLARYFPLLAKKGSMVIARCPPELRRLIERVPGVKQTITTDEPIPPHDLQIPIFSLPLRFHTDAKTIPRAIPYITADPQKAARYATNTGRKRIGLAWAGFTGHGNDRRRSCPADQFNTLAEIDGVDFYRLQMPPSLAPPSALALIDHTATLADFDETAALIANLDLVITVDTSIAHLAGAMGKPVWILLPFAADWRWQTHREDSPWYPTARLFRQTIAGDWAGAMERVRDALRDKTDPG